MVEKSERISAVLLLGPTGSGKTPLGDWLQEHGLWGRGCHHFDFGHCLRETVERPPSPDFTTAEVAFLRKVLKLGVLLENESFYLAQKLMEAFIAGRRIKPGEWVILNGLPRHIGQAEALEPRIRVTDLIVLECSPEVIAERLRNDAGGDRRSRTDDSPELVRRKLMTYAQRTQPLISHYHTQGARLISVQVTGSMRALEMAWEVEAFPKQGSWPG